MPARAPKANLGDVLARERDGLVGEGLREGR
jgi:hypothetical protein